MKDSGKNVAITGSTGFIGSSFAEKARRDGFNLRVLGRRDVRTDERDEFVKFDLEENSNRLEESLAGCSSIVHLAAHIPSNQSDPNEARRCLEINSLGTLRLLEAATKAGVETFIHTSSANAYVSGIAVADERTSMFPVERAAYYLTSKLAQEIFGCHWSMTHPLRVVCLRLSSVYGPGQMQGAIPGMARTLLKGEKVRLRNGGHFGADFVLVDDVVGALLAVLMNNIRGSYNIGSGMRREILDVSKILIELLGAREDQVEIEDSNNELDKGFPALDVSKAINDFSYSPRMLEEGLSLFVKSIGR